MSRRQCGCLQVFYAIDLYIKITFSLEGSPQVYVVTLNTVHPLESQPLLILNTNPVCYLRPGVSG